MSADTTYLSMDLLRFTTAGSVDDGKSTLIGRLLYDSKAIFQDQLEAIERATEQRGEDHFSPSISQSLLISRTCRGTTVGIPKSRLLLL